MAVRTKLLAAGRRSDATTVVVYTCPDGETCILKDVRLVNLSATEVLNIVVGMDAATFNQTLWGDFTIGTRQTIHLEVWHVVPAGAEITVRGDVKGSCNYWLSGTELEGVAD